MSGDWSDDEQLLAELGEAMRAERDVPERMVEIGRAAFSWYSADLELAALTWDSAEHPEALAGTRTGPTAPRTLSFAGQRLGVELEVTADAVVGQLVPAQAGAVEVQTPDGSSVADADEVGWFTVRPRPSGLFRLRVSGADGTEVTTEWIRP